MLDSNGHYIHPMLVLQLSPTPPGADLSYPQRSPLHKFTTFITMHFGSILVYQQKQTHTNSSLTLVFWSFAVFLNYVFNVFLVYHQTSIMLASNVGNQQAILFKLKAAKIKS